MPFPGLGIETAWINVAPTTTRSALRGWATSSWERKKDGS
jgi:hypothetical protein